MPSPDLRSYHALALFDKGAAELLERALVDAVSKLPGWRPREGNTELVLLEAMALLVDEAIFTVNRLPDAVVEVLMRLYGITRDLGAPSTTTVRFTVADALGHVIPAGTRVRLTLAGDVVDFITNVGLAIPGGQTAGNVAATATRNGAVANGTPVNTPLELVDAVPFVDAVVIQTIPTGGAEAETDAEWRDRAVTRFSRVTDVLVTASHFTAAALEWPTVQRATTIDNHNGAGAANGHVAVAVAAAAGVALAAQDKVNLEADLEERSQVNLDVHVIDPTITAVAVTAEVKRLAGFDNATVVANVQAAIRAYLNPDSWPWAGTVRRNELIALLDGVDGVDYVVSLTAPAADVVLAGVAPLADDGSLNITTS